jgi:polysaccharide biosynthesis protein PelE
MDVLRCATGPALPPVPGVWVRAAMPILFFGTICAELVISAAVLDAVSLPVSLLQAQLIVSWILLVGATVLYQYGSRDPVFLLLVIATIAMGPFGAIGAGVSVVMRWFFARRATPFEDWYAALVPKLEISPTRALHERIALRGGGPDARSSVAPFSDVMVLGTLQQKQAVITMIADEFRPSFAPALRSALNDPEPAIRVQAATATARIESRFLRQAMALEERRVVASDEPDLLLALARHHDAYANTGLLDTSRAQSERRQALDCYERVAQLRSGTPEVEQAMGRLLLRLGQPERALQHLERLAEGAEATPEVLAWYMECLYRLRRVSSLRRAAHRHMVRIAASDLPYGVREAVRLWAEGEADNMLAAGEGT